MVTINKMPPRYNDPSSTLPCFLQRGQKARYALNDFNQKAYESNNYKNRQTGIDFTSFKSASQSKLQLGSTRYQSGDEDNFSMSSDDSLHDFLRTKGEEMF